MLPEWLKVRLRDHLGQVKAIDELVLAKGFTHKREERVIQKQNPKAGLSGNHRNRS